MMDIAQAGRYAYLGPRGTFCEQAVGALFPAGDVEPVPFPSIEAALDAARAGLAVGAVVPIESSVEGGVTATLDELATGAPLTIRAEVLVPVEFALLARPGTELGDVKLVGGHPAAQAQCRRWLAAQLPDATWCPAPSNADAARLVAEGQLDAALAAGFAARPYRLATLAGGVHDKAGAVTRFVQVGCPERPPGPTGRDRTSVAAFLVADHPGALMDILSQFAVRGVNLSRIDSRPTGDGIGRYFFFIDCEGHVEQASVGEALMGLRRTCSAVRFLGSYARHDQQAQAGPAEGGTGIDQAEAVFADAAAWLGQVRAP